DQQWMTVPSGRVLTPQSMRPGLLPDAVHTGQLFRIANLRSSLAKRLTVWPSRSLSGTFFAPGGVRYLESSAEMPTVDAFGILRADNVVPETPYSVFTDDVMTHDARSAANVTEERAQMMTTPPDWAVTDPGLRSLAAEVFSGSQTPGQKIGAVKEWFARHGRYGQEVDVPNDVSEDSVAWFLKENPPAHCEYFASGTAVLLRMAGVQCRYVTGFLVTEQNRYGAGWMARNRDAHAWVEAWDGESQWIIVETTPGDGIPSGAVTGAWQQFYEYTLGSLQRFRAAWQQRRFGLLGDLLMLVVTTPIGIISLTALFALAVRKRCYRFWLAGSSARSRKGSKHSLRLQSTFRAVDRLAHRIATPRARGETLMAFAGRLDEVAGASTVAVRRTADWYRNYSTLLYRGEQTDHESEVLYSEGRRLLPVLRQFKRPQGETPTSDTLEDQ
ncbi:MAG: transglutaminase-like domain-containing protein, partial [Planctomycetaceae bacterium]